MVKINTYYCDGSGWNGEKSRFVVMRNDVVLIDETTDEEFTNNQMEYAAVLNAMIVAKPNDTIYTDSQLVVGQVTTGWKVNVMHLKPFQKDCETLWRYKALKLLWVKRDENKAGVFIENGK